MPYPVTRLFCLPVYLAGLSLTATVALAAQPASTPLPATAASAPDTSGACIAPITYLPLDPAQVGADTNGMAALGTYERISPDGRFILRSYSGAQLGQVSLMELPAQGTGPIRAYRTPFSNEAFPVQGTWRYLVDVNGDHYRFAQVLREQTHAKPLFRAGMTGFYAVASEMPANHSAAPDLPAGTIFIRSISWPQGNGSIEDQGVGPLQLETIAVQDDGTRARVIESTGAHYICARRNAIDGEVYALPMLSVDGRELSAIPQIPHQGQPTMRVYGLADAPMSKAHPCDLRADLGLMPAKAVFGLPSPDGEPARLVYSDLGNVYVFDRALGATFRLGHAKDNVLASAFPALTQDGRVIYGATWRDCPNAAACPERAGYVVIDPYQTSSYRRYWQAQGKTQPKACITTDEVAAQRAAFARRHGIEP